MSQSELDQLLRASESELDELRGSLAAEEKDHAISLSRLNKSTQAFQDQLWGEAADEKQAYREGREAYNNGTEEIAKLDGELKKAAKALADVSYEVSNVHTGLGQKLMGLESCFQMERERWDCMIREFHAAEKEAEKEAIAGDFVTDPSNPLGWGLSLVALRDPARVKRLQTGMEVEKIEAQLVAVTERQQAEQRDFDAGVRALQESKENLERNATTVSRHAEIARDHLAAEAEAQGRSQDALLRLVAGKKKQAHDTLSKLETLEQQEKKV